MLLIPLLALLPMQNAEITVNTLLPEMPNLDLLSGRPRIHYKEAQFSSYDRKSVAPDKPGWFANDDSGKYLRDETNDGRLEHVMADINGPGTITRIWSANPAGTLRFYFDGHLQPDITVQTGDLLSGKYVPIPAPFSYPASHGFDMYFPLPFSRGCKVTVDDNPSPSNHLYYHVNYRLYAPGTQVRTFSPDQIDPNLLRQVAEQLEHPTLSSQENIVHKVHWETPAGRSQAVEIRAKSPEAITELRIKVSTPFPASQSWSDPKQMHNLLRHLILEIEFDGETCVRVPISDFFADVPELAPIHSLPIDVDDDGTMVCRFVMPFQKKAVVRVKNVGAALAVIDLNARTEAHDFDAGTYLFHSQWQPELGSTRPMRDMEFLNVKGEGRYVGTALAVGNPSTSWWGEGDEKVYINGEPFPSTFGTGSEDYFGYAWGSNERFDDPYHGQPQAQGPGSFGYSCQHRWHLFDSFPFDSAFRFDLEEWHWAVCDCAYWGTTYWYARPGSTPALPIKTADLELKELLIPHEKGAIEGETMKVLEITGGTSEVQDGFPDCSGGAQLWWREGKVGDKLVLEVDAPKAGVYHASGHFCYAVDYGAHEITLNGTDLGRFDFWNPELTWKKVDFGDVTLKQGANRLEVTIKDPNPKMINQGDMFGLDYLKLDPR